MNDTVVTYNGESVLVSREVADYLEEDRKREQAEIRRDRRHLSKSEFETIPTRAVLPQRPVEDICLKNLRLEKLRAAIKDLDDHEQKLVDLRYQCYLTEDQIGKVFGISKMAVSKRLKKTPRKIAELCRMTGPRNFFVFLVYKCSPSVLRSSRTFPNGRQG